MQVLTDITTFITTHPALFGFAFVSVEYWLGKTDAVKSGSVAEIVLSGIAKALSALGVKA